MSDDGGREQGIEGGKESGVKDRRWRAGRMMSMGSFDALRILDCATDGV